MNEFHFLRDYGLELTQEVINAPYPIIGWCCVGQNFIHKQCESAPTQYSNEDNSWAEEYAVELALKGRIRFYIEQIIDQAPKNSGFELYFNAHDRTYYGYEDFHGSWYSWLDMGHLKHLSDWNRTSLFGRNPKHFIKIEDLRSALKNKISSEKNEKSAG